MKRGITTYEPHLIHLQAKLFGRDRRVHRRSDYTHFTRRGSGSGKIQGGTQKSIGLTAQRRPRYLACAADPPEMHY